MSKARVWIIAVTLVVASLATLASAADVGQVVKACDDMHDAGKTCNYGIQGNSLVGCTENVVFVCPADGSRTCTGSKNTTGKCNEDGTAARRIPPKRLRTLDRDAILNEMKK
jgi:hypothetical protein